MSRLREARLVFIREAHGRTAILNRSMEKMRDELLNGEIFYTLKEAQILIEMWRKGYNTIRPHSALDFSPPLPVTIMVPNTQFQTVGLT